MSSYSKVQIQFIMNLRKQGKTFPAIAEAFGKRFGEKKSEDAMRRAFESNKADYDLKGLKSQVEIKAEVMIKRIMDAFTNQVIQRKYVPILSEFCTSARIDDESVKRYFGSFEGLEKQARQKYPKIFKDVLDETKFDDEAFKELRQDVAGYKRFIITTAVTGCEPHEEGLLAIKTFCDRNKAKLLILPCSDPAKQKEKKHKHRYSLDHRLPRKSIVFRNLTLNSNIYLSTIKLTAKQIKPLTGLRRLTKHGSCVLASPKQFLAHVASSNKKEIPRALMTTGAITVSNYRTEMYMSERTATLADEDHQLGAVIIEIKDSRVFFSRRIQIDPKTGSFSDLNKMYHADGSVTNIQAELVQQPDWHVLSTCPEFRAAAKEVVELMKPEFMTFEDFFDGVSINPHEEDDIIERAVKALKGQLNLANELKACSKEIDELAKWPAKQLIFKYGNHEDFILRWLKKATYASDPANHYEGVCLAKARLEGVMPFEHAMRERYPIKCGERVKFLGVDDSFIVGGIENAVHGHIGSNGKRNPTLEGLEDYGLCNTGHTHSAAIFRGVVRVGTATVMQLGYNVGASAWTNTLNIQHYDGARQLITVIDGEWCLPDIL